MIFADIRTAITSSDSIVLVIAGVTSLVLGALNVRNRYSSGQDAQTIKSLKESISTFSIRRESDQLIIDSKIKEVDLLKQKAEVLESHVTQAPQINKLTIQLATQHKEMMTAMAEMSKNNATLAVEIGNIAKAMTKETLHADKR